MVHFEYDKTVMRYSFGLGVSSLDHRRREEFPAIFYIGINITAVTNIAILSLKRESALWK